MARRTPPLYARGLYTVTLPWILTPNVLYTCKAIRSFDDLYELDINVFKEFYQSMGLSQGVFDADLAQKAAIITLQSEDGTEFIYIPDTYIVSYPGMDDIAYSHMVLSADLGPLPDYLNLDFLKTQVANIITETIGVTTPVIESRAPHSGAITPANHAIMELARTGAITLNESDYARALRLQIEKDNLQAQVDAMIQIMKDAGIFV